MSALFLINFTVFFNPMLDSYSNSLLHVVLELGNTARTASVTFLAFIICVLPRFLVGEPDGLQLLLQAPPRRGRPGAALVALVQVRLQLRQLLLRAVQNHPQLFPLRAAPPRGCPLQTQQKWAGSVGRDGLLWKARKECRIPAPGDPGSLLPSA